MSDDFVPAAPPFVISKESVTEGAEAVVFSNVTIVNALFEEFLDDDEIAGDALTAYYVDYYAAEVDNGGHDQFLVNSQLRGTLSTTVSQGLRAIGAPRHAEVFERLIGAIDALPEIERDAYLRGRIDRDIDLAELDDEYFALAQEESLTDLLAAWLPSRPGVTLVPRSELQAWIAARAAQIDPAELERRREVALRSHDDDMPVFERRIRALCEVAGFELGRITAGDPSHVHEGTETLAWYFLNADDQLHYMVDTGAEALMFDDADGALVAALPSP